MSVLGMWMAWGLSLQVSGATAEVDETAADVVELSLPTEAPDEWSVTVPWREATHEFWLVRHSLRADDVDVAAWVDGTLQSRELPEVRTYRGHVDGDVSRIVLASLTDDGLVARVVEPVGEHWSIRPAVWDDATAPLGTHHIDVAPPALGPFDDCPTCGDADWFDPAGGGGGPPVPYGDRRQFGDCAPERAELAFDADYEYYLLSGGTIPATIQRIEAHLNEVDYFFARDAGITYETTQFVVRTSTFYNNSDAYNLLDLFRVEWATNLRGVPRDLVHLMTAKGNLGNIAGLAYVGVVCSLDYGYGLSVDSAGVLGHELGHNWGAGHCHDVTPCNSMCGACLFIAPVTRDIIMAHRDSRDCLERAGAYETPVPPYPSADRVTVSRSRLAFRGHVVLDPLVNDDDANCETLFIADFDRRTPQGARVRLSKGGGPEGRDVLLYEPTFLFAGTDSVRYSAGDGTGFESPGSITVEITAPGVTAYLPLDENGGDATADRSARGHDGTLVGGPTWTDGKFGSSLRFKQSAPSHVNVTSDQDFEFGDAEDFSVSMWVKVPGWSGSPLFVSNKNWSNGGLPGLAIGPHSDDTSWQWNLAGTGGRADGVGGVINDDVWHHLVVTHDRDGYAELWQDDAFVRRVWIADVGNVDTGLPMSLAQDGTRTFPDALRARVDEVWMFRHVLDRDEIHELFAGRHLQAFGPRPTDGGGARTSSVTLEWEAGSTAFTHDVYLGTDYRAVKRADPTSPEYLGNQGGSQLTVGPLLPEQPYYWRVDEVNSQTVAKGKVWSFTTVVPRAGRVGNWSLDDGSGTVALCTNDPNFDGSLENMSDSDWVTGHLGGALNFDGGADGYVKVGQKPSLRIEDELSIAAWVNLDRFSDFDPIVSYAEASSAGQSGYTLHARAGGAFGLGIAVEGFPGGMMYAATPGGYELNRWYHVVGTYDGATLRVYVDGRLVGQLAQAGAIDWEPKPSRGLEFGRWKHADTERRLDGRLDEITLWNRALRPADIQVLYNGGAGFPVR